MVGLTMLHAFTQSKTCKIYTILGEGISGMICALLYT